MKFNFPLGKKSLKRRFSYAIILAVLVIILLFGALAGVYSYNTTTARLNRQLGNVSEIAAAGLRSALWNYEKETIDEIIDAVFKEEGVACLRLIDDTGRIYEKETAELKGQGFTFYENSSRFRTRTSPIYRAGKQIGTVQLALSVDTFRRDLWVNIIGLTGLTLFVIAAVLAASFFIAGRYIFRPLKQLEKSVEAITKKELDTEVDTRAEDEIGNLARAFNQMREAIKKLIGDLEESRQGLERKVEERTADLERSKADLETSHAKLHRSQEKLKAVLDSIQRRVYWKDLFGLIEGGNNMLAKDLGLNGPEDLVGKTEMDLWKNNKRISRLFRKVTGEVKKDKKTRRNLERTYTDDNGEKRWLKIDCIPLKDENDKVVNILVAFRDITDEKKSETELKQSKITAEKANKAKDRFLANVSHEVRTPISTIVGFTDLFKTTNLNDRQSHYLNRIHKASRDLRRIIDDILDHSKMASGELEIAHEPFSLQDALDDVMDTFKPKAEKKHIALILEKKGGDIDALVGDGLRLKQVLINLVHNALRFTDKGEIRLTVEETKIEEYHIRVRLDVADTGCGIPPDKLEDVFKPYRQIDHPDKEELSQGIGLGLTISRQLVRLMGGELVLESKVGEGSRFYFEIAFERAPLPDRFSRDTEPEDDWSDLKSINVLVVEDDESSRELMEIMLTGVDMTVTTERNGNSALQKIVDGNYDIVLMDLKMPGMDGYQLTRALRKMERFKKLPIIAVTAYAMIGERYKCIKAGMNDYFSKPVDRDQLLSTIADYVAEVKERTSTPAAHRKPGKTTIALTPEDKALIRILKGIDVESGLNRVKLDLPAYITRLAAFVRTHAGTAGRIKEAIDRNDTQNARDLLHTLRGSAANHDAKTLLEVAAALHEAIKQGKPNLAPMVLELEHTLHQLTEAIHKAEKRLDDTGRRTTTPPPPPIDRAEWEHRLATLAALLAKDAFEAKKYFLEIIPYLQGNLPGQEANRLKDQIAKNQFKLALDTLKTITGNLGISLTEDK